VLQLVLSGIGWSANAVAAARSLPVTQVRTLMREEILAACTACTACTGCRSPNKSRAGRQGQVLNRVLLVGPQRRR
jgi:positive regulator of sigma E activity